MTKMSPIHAVAKEIVDVVGDWLQQNEEKQGKAMKKTVNRTSLQIGIHNLLHMRYTQDTLELFTWISDFGSAEHESRIRPLDTPLNQEQVKNILIPLLEQGIRQKLQAYENSVLLDYRVQVSIEMQPSETLVILHEVNEQKREMLLQRIHTYIANKLENASYPTDPLESFFLSNHLVDPVLFPNLDTAFVMRIYERVMELNKANPQKLKEHQGNFIRAFQHWTEEELLPAYFHRNKPQWGRVEYIRKAGLDLASINPQQLELALQTAILIIKYEPNYSRQNGLDILERLQELGYTRAAQVIKEGSGTLPEEVIQYKDPQIECQAHDVFSTITIRIKEEHADSYGKGLDFICALLSRGFFRSYQIKLKSSAKQFLDVPGLAKSQTHRFFANALQYEELHPKLAAYARLAMVEFEWYEDTDGEKNCMPGTYAVFGLGLKNPAFFPLVEDYMQVVDDEHQSVQIAFTSALITHYGVDETTLPTIVACLLRCQDGKFTKFGPVFEEPANLEALAAIMKIQIPYEARHVAELIWGSMEKLEKKAQAAKGDLAHSFTSVLSAASRKK